MWWLIICPCVNVDPHFGLFELNNKHKPVWIWMWNSRTPFTSTHSQISGDQSVLFTRATYVMSNGFMKAEVGREWRKDEALSTMFFPKVTVMTWISRTVYLTSPHPLTSFYMEESLFFSPSGICNLFLTPVINTHSTSENRRLCLHVCVDSFKYFSHLLVRVPRLWFSLWRVLHVLLTTLWHFLSRTKNMHIRLKLIIN